MTYVCSSKVPMTGAKLFSVTEINETGVNILDKNPYFSPALFRKCAYFFPVFGVEK